MPPKASIFLKSQWSIKLLIKNNYWGKKKRKEKRQSKNTKRCYCGAQLQTLASVQRLTLSCIQQTPNLPPVPSLVLTFCLQNTDYSLHRSRVSVSHTGEKSLVCSSSSFTTANHFLTGFIFFLRICCNQCHSHGPLYLNTSSFTNAISLLAKRGLRQCKHHTPTHENFRINDSFSEAAM